MVIPNSILDTDKEWERNSHSVQFMEHSECVRRNVLDPVIGKIPEETTTKAFQTNTINSIKD